MSDLEIEKEIVAKGLTAPRVTPAQVENSVRSEAYYVFPGTTVTVCCLTLVNGFTAVGYSAAASPENFDEELGRKIARTKARDQVWALEGYLLRQRLHEEGLRARAAAVHELVDAMTPAADVDADPPPVG